MKFAIQSLVAASALALLSACGGDDSPGQPSATPLAITSTNQTDVARASVNGPLAVSLASGSLGGGGASAASVADRSHAMGAALARVLQAAVGQRKGVASAGAHASAVSSSSSACTDGGSLTTSFDDKDGNGQLTAGDVITAAFAQCADSSTFSINGTVVITLAATPTQTQLSAAAQFQNVTVVDTGSTSTISGAVNLTETDTTTQSTTTLTVGGAGLAVGLSSTGYTDTLGFDAGTAFMTSLDNASESATLSVNGGFSSHLLGGHVAITTSTPLFQANTDDYPSSGVVLVTGASGSKLLLTVISSSQVQLQLDANGDGSYESTSTVAWSTLAP